MHLHASTSLSCKVVWFRSEQTGKRSHPTRSQLPGSDLPLQASGSVTHQGKNVPRSGTAQGALHAGRISVLRTILVFCLSSKQRTDGFISLKLHCFWLLDASSFAHRLSISSLQQSVFAEHTAGKQSAQRQRERSLLYGFELQNEAAGGNAEYLVGEQSGAGFETATGNSITADCQSEWWRKIRAPVSIFWSPSRFPSLAANLPPTLFYHHPFFRQMRSSCQPWRFLDYCDPPNRARGRCEIRAILIRNQYFSDTSNNVTSVCPEKLDVIAKEGLFKYNKNNNHQDNSLLN